MKLGKFLSLAALLLAFSVPAMANSGNGTGDGHGGNWGLGEDVYYGNHGRGPGGWWRAPNHRRFPRAVECFARNARGRTFVGFARRANRAQREAMQSCRAHSFNPRTCRPLGCR